MFGKAIILVKKVKNLYIFKDKNTITFTIRQNVYNFKTLLYIRKFLLANKNLIKINLI